MADNPDLLIALCGTNGRATTETVRFRDLRQHLASLWTVHPDTDSKSSSDDELDKPPPDAVLGLTSSWTEALDEVKPLVSAASDRIRNIFAQPWLSIVEPRPESESPECLVVNVDYGLDDKMNVVSKLCEADTDSGFRPSLILLAGVKNGKQQRANDAAVGMLQPTETFVEMKKDLTALFEHEPDEILRQGHVVRWSDCNVTLISGADLQQTAEADWIAQARDKFKGPSVRTRTAAANLEDVLDGRKYTLHILTSAVLPGGLSDKVRNQCKGALMTNAFFANQQGQIEPAANGRFDLKALHDMMMPSSGCAFKCPVAFTHGGLSGYMSQVFADLSGWGKILKTAVPNPETWREDIRDSMMNYSKWACQMEAALLGTYGKDYVSHHFSRFQDEAGLSSVITSEESQSDQIAQLVAAHPWAKETLEAESYQPDKAARALRLRQRCLGFEHLLNTSLADMVPTLADGQSPQSAFYLPVSIDLEAISKNQKPSTAKLDVEHPNAYLLISGDEKALTERITATIGYLRVHTSSKESGSGEMHPIVDETLAKEIQLWMRLQAKTAESICKLSDSWTFKEDDKTGRNTVGQMAKLCTEVCRTGATVHHANNIVSSGQ